MKTSSTSSASDRGERRDRAWRTAGRSVAATIAALAVFCSPVAAQTFTDTPDAYEAATAVDVLAAPREGAPALTRLPAGSAPIEIAIPWTADGEPPRFGRVSFAEGDGWVRLDQLRPAPQPLIGETALPVGLRCVGTEPFWALDLTQADQAMLQTPWLDGETRLDIRAAIPAEARGGAPAALRMDAGPLGGALAMVSVAACSDGMSDVTYPWIASLLLGAEGSERLFEGCCRLPGPLMD